MVYNIIRNDQLCSCVMFLVEVPAVDNNCLAVNRIVLTQGYIGMYYVYAYCLLIP